MLAALLLLAALAFPPAAGAESLDLAPYRELVQGPGGARLLAMARRTMERAGRAAQTPAAPDSTPPTVAPDSAAAPAWPGPPVPVYVSLTSGSTTRACVGLPAAARPSLGETVRAAALAALSADRRRPPVTSEELRELRIVISFTDEGEPVTSPMLVDPGREGLLVSSPRGSVAFLPGEARTIHWALSEARRLGILRDRLGDTAYRRLQVVTLAEAPHGAAPNDEATREEE